MGWSTSLSLPRTVRVHLVAYARRNPRASRGNYSLPYRHIVSTVPYRSTSVIVLVMARGIHKHVNRKKLPKGIWSKYPLERKAKWLLEYLEHLEDDQLWVIDGYSWCLQLTSRSVGFYREKHDFSVFVAARKQKYSIIKFWEKIRKIWNRISKELFSDLKKIQNS